MSDQENKHDGWNPYNFENYDNYVYNAIKENQVYMSWMEWTDKHYTFIAKQKAEKMLSLEKK